jgi:Holliday junction resolvasome RuvABC endonuclease subunit
MITQFIGVDPGLSGGIARLVVRDGIVRPEVYPMPETERELWELMHQMNLGFPLGTVFALVERVHAMPRNGSIGNFKLGQSYGSLRLVMVACCIPFEEVTPAKWQKAMGCLTGGDKNISKARAQQLFPEVKLTHRTADALLIAEHCRRTRNERTPEHAHERTVN